MQSLAGQTLLIATGNNGKLAEFSAMLAPLGTTLVSLQNIGLTEPEETASFFAGNARIKALAGLAGSGLPTLADDSGLLVEGFGGAPGVYTADWAEHEVGRDFTVAMRKVWALLEALRVPPPRRARFHCTLALAWPDGAVAVFDGEIEGEIVWPPRGSTGHGFDPVFRPLGHLETFAEMPENGKNRISHRAVALGKLRESCFT